MATLGEMSVRELVESAISEMTGLSEFIRSDLPKLTRDQSLLVNAYIGSIQGRLCMAGIKLKSSEQQQRLGMWIATNLRLPDRLEAEDVDEAIRVLGNSSVPVALEEIRSDTDSTERE